MTVEFMTASQQSHRLQRFVSGYEMVFVLLLLMLLFTVLTWKEQTPSGGDAGQQVADKILNQDAQAVVIVAAGASTADLSFVRAAEERLSSGGATVV